MGVYLSNMEMPTRRWDCLLNTYGYCMASEHSDIIPSGAPIPDWCPLIPVPPHGRLIDADEMKESIRMQAAFLIRMGGEIAEMAETLEKGFLQEIDNAPTIIEAEEGQT